MENLNLFLNLSTILLLPLVPAFILYKFLPSETVVKGPFKGLDVNLTGAFGGYFLLVIISLGLSYYSLNNQLTEKLQASTANIQRLNEQITDLNSVIARENKKYRQWKMIGEIDSKSPELTKIFIDQENISINSLGKFKASLVIKTDDNNKPKFPDAVCFYNQSEGYSVIDLSKNEKAIIDTTVNEIRINNKIKLSVPGKYARTADFGY